MYEEFRGGCTVMRPSICVYDQRHQLFSLVTRQVELPIVGRIPRPDSATKDNTVAGIQEHLSPTAGITLACPTKIAFEDDSDIANARSRGAQLPRFASSLEECGRGEVPR